MEGFEWGGENWKCAVIDTEVWNSLSYWSNKPHGVVTMGGQHSPSPKQAEISGRLFKQSLSPMMHFCNTYKLHLALAQNVCFSISFHFLHHHYILEKTGSYIYLSLKSCTYMDGLQHMLVQGTSVVSDERTVSNVSEATIFTLTHSTHTTQNTHNTDSGSEIHYVVFLTWPFGLGPVQDAI